MNIEFDDLELPLALLASAGAGVPRPAARDRLMERIRREHPAVPEGFTFHMAEDGSSWRPHPVPGIQMKVLSVDRVRGCATLLLDVAAGTRFPPHHHSGAEECYVISGSLFTCGRCLGPGDFVHADADTHHAELWTDTGCQVLLVVTPEDYM